MQAKVEGEEGVVLANAVAEKVRGSVGGRRRSDGVGRVRLHAHIPVESPRQVGNSVSVEFVTFVTIRIRVFGRQVEQVGVTERKGIAFVGVIVAVTGVRIVGVKQEMVAHALAHADGESAVERLRGADSISNAAEVCEGGRNAGTAYIAGIDHNRAIVGLANARCNVCVMYGRIRRKCILRSAIESGANAFVRIDEACKVNAFGHGEISVGDVITDELLLVAHVCRIDARVRVVLVENGYAGARRRRRPRGGKGVRVKYGGGSSLKRRCVVTLNC